LKKKHNKLRGGDTYVPTQEHRTLTFSNKKLINKKRKTKLPSMTMELKKKTILKDQSAPPPMF
jgi:hypothetical protein